MAGAIRLRWGHTELGWALMPMTGVLTREGKFGHNASDTKGRMPCDNEGRDGVVLLQPRSTEDWQHPLEPRGNEEGPSPTACREGMAVPTT